VTALVNGKMVNQTVREVDREEIDTWVKKIVTQTVEIFSTFTSETEFFFYSASWELLLDGGVSDGASYGANLDHANNVHNFFELVRAEHQAKFAGSASLADFQTSVSVVSGGSGAAVWKLISTRCTSRNSSWSFNAAWWTRVSNSFSADFYTWYSVIYQEEVLRRSLYLQFGLKTFSSTNVTIAGYLEYLVYYVHWSAREWYVQYGSFEALDLGASVQQCYWSYGFSASDKLNQFDKINRFDLLLL
jgi:hypothetical protein